MNRSRATTHLEETEVVEVLADVVDDLAPGDKYISGG